MHGRTYVVVKPDSRDSIQALAIKFGTTDREIMIANQLIGDQIWHLTELLVPAPKGVSLASSGGQSRDLSEAIHAERERRKAAID